MKNIILPFILSAFITVSLAQNPKDCFPQEQFDEKMLSPLSLEDQQFLKSIPEIKKP